MHASLSMYVVGVVKKDRFINNATRQGYRVAVVGACRIIVQLVHLLNIPKYCINDAKSA